MEQKMFCYQCQETAGCKGCTVVGVCGKQPGCGGNAGFACVGDEGYQRGDDTASRGGACGGR